MGMATSKVRLNICGSSYVVNTSESEDYMKNLADRLNLDMNELMEKHKLSMQETERINEAMHLKMRELDRVIDQAGKLVSQFTNYPAFALTAGLVSAKDREVTLSNSLTMDLIHTDCAINSGNSGGPLFNSHGEVIGIVSAKYSSSASSSSASVEGLGFAIPMDDVADMVSELVTNGYVTGKPLMGISVGDVAEDVQAYGVPAGAAVKVVTPGLCGEKAGLQEGDIITKINDTEVASGNDLITAKDNYKPGDTVNLTVYRDGKTITVKLTLEESTPEKTAQQDQAQKEYEEQQQQQLQQEQQQGSGGWPFGGFGY